MDKLKAKDLGRAIAMARHFCEEENCTLCRDALKLAMDMWGEWQRASDHHRQGAVEELREWVNEEFHVAYQNANDGDLDDETQMKETARYEAIGEVLAKLDTLTAADAGAQGTGG